MTAMALMIDTLTFADVFERTGFQREHACALATALSDAQAVSIEELATKKDLLTNERALKQDMAGPARDIAELDRKFSSDLREQIAGSELTAQRRSNPLMLAC